MRNFLLALLVFFIGFTVKAQELNALVTINSDKIQSSNKQVYNTLQTALTEFLNQTEWTQKKFKPQERINCAFTIIVNEQNGNQFNASLQIQATRPVYGSSYATPLLNINDTNFNFQYNEFEPLIYNPNSFDSNLVSTIVFYAYTILGVDADSFAKKGGEKYYKIAQNAALQAQQGGGAGWQNQIGKQNRFTLIDNLLSSKFVVLRNIFYEYHRNGFDFFVSDKSKAKMAIENSVMQLDRLHNITVGNYMIRVFLDAKSDEIVSVFSDGKPTSNQQRMLEILYKIAPTYTDKWKKIKS